MKKKIKIALVQSNTIWNDVSANFLAIKSLTKDLESVDFIFFPEMFDTGFITNPVDLIQQNDTLQWLRDFSIEHNCWVGGTTIYPVDNYYVNRFFILNDKQIFYYDKRHLFSVSNEDKVVKRGNKRTIAHCDGWNINMLICYDLRFPVWSRNRGEYDIAVYPANWPITRIEQWRALLIARAIENQAYVIGINRTGTDNNGFVYDGHSLVVDPKGKVMLELDAQEQVAICEFDYDYLQKTRQTFPVLKDADNFQIID